MKNFEVAKELFKDINMVEAYFNGKSTSLARQKIKDAIDESITPLIILSAQSGVGKSFLLQYIHYEMIHHRPSFLVKHPYRDQEMLLHILTQMPYLKAFQYDTLDIPNEKLMKLSPNLKSTIFIDETEFLSQKQLELISTAIKTNMYQFIFASTEGKNAYFHDKQYIEFPEKVFIPYGNLEENEILHYLQNLLIVHGHEAIAALFSNNEIKKLYRYTKGNFRTVKQFLYTLIKLLNYTQEQGLSQYQRINNCILSMTALEIGLLHDT